MGITDDPWGTEKGSNCLDYKEEAKLARAHSPMVLTEQVFACDTRLDGWDMSTSNKNVSFP